MSIHVETASYKFGIVPPAVVYVPLDNCNPEFIRVVPRRAAGVVAADNPLFRYIVEAVRP